MNGYWTVAVGAMARLEDCAANPGTVATLNADEARALLDELWLLRDGTNNKIGNAHDFYSRGNTIPPAPEREGEQFEDRHGHVWTWTDFWRLDVSGTVRDCLVREDDDQDITATWPDAWIEHGPLWPVGRAPNTAHQTILRTRLIINGTLAEVSATVDDEWWDRGGEPFHAYYTTELRRRLVAAIAEQLRPPVSVQRAPRWIREANAGIRNRYPRKAGPET